MTINGEQVCEIDIRACNLTLLHGKLRVPFDASSDPYARVGLEREIVKAWITASIGAGRPLLAWPEDDLDLEEVAPARMVHDRTLETYPALGRIGEPGVTWGELMYTESWIIISTMVHLQHRGIASLPVHDSLIVPLSKTGLAAGLLIDHFNIIVGAYPGISTKSTLPGAREAVERAVAAAIARGERYSRSA
jgi:hypothetical protein